MVKRKKSRNRSRRPAAFRCDICGSRINSYPFVDNNLHFVSNKGTPASLYWNNDLEEVYCSPHCSLKSLNRT